MKAPITQAQAWAVIAESAGWNAKELPVLPESAEETWRNNARYFIYTADQLQAYGAACAAHAREMALSEAKKIIEAYKIPVGNSASGELACEWTYSALKEIRDQIEALKGNV